jgi:predicted RNA-binding protein with PUA-like domain
MACLDNDFTDTLTHLTAHNFVTVFCCPDDVKSVVKFGMASCGIVKADGRLDHMILVRNSRLSVQPVSDAEWNIVCQLAGISD